MSADSLNDKARVEVEAAIYSRRKIDAIKLYRQAVPGTDLVDAKKAVEALETKLRGQHPENFGPAASKTGCLGIILVVAGLIGGLTLLAAFALHWN